MDFDITRDRIEEIVLQRLPTVYFRPFLGIFFENVFYNSVYEYNFTQHLTVFLSKE